MRKVSKGILLFTVFGLVFTSAIGCATQQKPEETRQQQDQTQQVRDQGRMNRTTDQARNRVNRTTDQARTRMGQNMRVADDVAESVARLDAIDSATVMVTDRTAYVGVMMNKNYKGGMTTKIKDQVAKRVRKEDRSVERVFVSASPGFVDEMGDYARDVRDGRPISGLFQGFSDLIERTFPAAR